MARSWLTELECATSCFRCNRKLDPGDHRILSAYDHTAICMSCKEEEKKRSDYEEVSQNIMEQCLIEAEERFPDPRSYCYHHFYPYKCS